MPGFEFENPLDKRVLKIGMSRFNPEFGEVKLRANTDDSFDMTCRGNIAEWLDRKVIQGCLDHAFGENWKHFETTEFHRIERNSSVFKKSGRRITELRIVFENGDTRFVRCRNGKLMKTVVKKRQNKKKPIKKKKKKKV